jgi:DNA ligase-1
VIKKGKNLGKANETTPFEQAKLEAQAQWEKKKKSKGYVETLKDARAGKRDALVEGGIDPMLAHRFDEQGHKIVYPAFLQPKLDGHRCIAMLDASGKCTLWSRTRKPINSVPHIVAAVEAIGLPPLTVVDGELYNHSYRDRFEELTSFIRQESPKPGHEAVEYHIYDLAQDRTPYHLRYETLRMDAKYRFTWPLHVVKTVEVTDEDELMLAFEEALAHGYEGAIVRNANGLYVNKRSYDLQKVKEFIDEEFVVSGVEEGRGKLEGHGIFVCKTKDGTEFRAKMKGSLESLKQYYENPGLAIGKQLTVKFQGYTAKNGVPRFPVALRLREDV